MLEVEKETLALRVRELESWSADREVQWAREKAGLLEDFDRFLLRSSLSLALTLHLRLHPCLCLGLCIVFSLFS